jgi:deazaflavin-dependent oxidoreductase (nitroreductase family)
MRGSFQAAMRRLTKVMRPIALKSAGKVDSNTSVVHHVGRLSGKTYETPVVAVEHEDCFLVALPYGERSDWLCNVLAKGKAEITSHGERYPVDQPKVIPISEATLYFRPKEQRLQRRFGVESALQVHRV